MQQSDVKLFMSLFLNNTWPKLTPGMRQCRDVSLFTHREFGSFDSASLVLQVLFKCSYQGQEYL